MKLEFSWQIFKKFLYIKFYENPSSGNQVVPWGQTDIMKLVVTFCNFANVPKTFKNGQSSDFVVSIPILGSVPEIAILSSDSASRGEWILLSL